MIGKTEYSLELVLPPHEQKEEELFQPKEDAEAEKEWAMKVRERNERRAEDKKELEWKMAEARGYLLVYSATDPPSFQRIRGYVLTIGRVTGFLHAFSFFFSFFFFSSFEKSSNLLFFG